MQVTKEQVRQQLISNAQQIENQPIIWRHLSPLQQAMCKASEKFWADTSPVVENALDEYTNIINQQNMLTGKSIPLDIRSSEEKRIALLEDQMGMVAGFLNILSMCLSGQGPLEVNKQA